MHKCWFIFFNLFFLYMPVSSQQLIIKVDKDTLYIHEYIKVEITLKNLPGNFETPVFSEWNLISGPNVSSDFSMINGVVNQKKVYTYILQPKHTGVQFLEQITFRSENADITSEPLPVVVLAPNANAGRSNVTPKTFTYGFDEKSLPSTKPKRVLKKI